MKDGAGGESDITDCLYRSRNVPAKPSAAFLPDQADADPVSDTASFTGYNKGGFDRNEQIRLKQCCDELTKRGVKFMLSNSATDFIKDLYKDYDITIVKAKRAINADASKRGAIEEVLIRNYGTE